MRKVTLRFPTKAATDLGARRVPTEPFVGGPKETVVSFYAAENRLPVVYDLLEDLSIRYKISAVRPFRGDRGPLAALTERQRGILEPAPPPGYFDPPAKTSLAKLARITGVSAPAVGTAL